MSILKKIINRVLTRPLLKRSLQGVGKNFRMGYSGEINCPNSFLFGHNFFSGPHCYFSSNKDTPIIIGSDVMFGPDCKIIGGNHNIDWDEGRMMFAPYVPDGRGIVIEDDVWVGAGTTLLDGSIVKEGCVIAAGAVLTTTTIPYSIYGGVPAKFIKPRFSKQQLINILNATRSDYCVIDILADYEAEVAK